MGRAPNVVLGEDVNRLKIGPKWCNHFFKNGAASKTIGILFFDFQLLKRPWVSPYPGRQISLDRRGPDLWAGRL